MVRQLCVLITIVVALGSGYQSWSHGEEWIAYTPRDGLADNAVTAVAVDDEQNIWFGTMSGVSKFDGTNWTTYRTADGLAFDLVLSIDFDPDGNAWIGTIMGVSKFDGRFWKTYTTADGLADNFVRDILVDHRGSLWFATQSGGISRFDGANWETYNSQNALSSDGVSSIVEDENGDLWLGTDSGVNRFDGVDWTTYTPDDGLADYDVYSIAIDGEGNKWFATGGGVSKFDGRSWTTYTTADGLAFDTVTSILVDDAEVIWIGAADGSIQRLDGEVWHTHSAGVGEIGPRVLSMASDENGNLWVGLQGQSVRMFPRASWTTAVTSTSGIASNYVGSIAVDEQGGLWAGTYDKGVSYFDGSSWKTYTTTDGLAGNSVHAICVDRNGSVWFGTEGNGVSRFDGSNWQTYTVADGLAGNNILSIVEDKAGNLWFGTSQGGIGVFDGVNWQTHRPLILPQVGEVIDAWGLAAAENGDVWAAGSRYVGRFDGTDWTLYTTADGLMGLMNTGIAISGDGIVWVATSGGVAQYDGERWRIFTTTDGLADQDISSIAIDENGGIWAGMAFGGIVHFDGTNWSARIVAERNEYTDIDTIDIGTIDIGKLGDEILENVDLGRQIVNAIVNDNDGNLWFATFGGVIHYLMDRVPPKTYITNAPEGTIGIDTVLIEFVGADLVTSTSGLSYSYKLDDASWSEFSESPRVEYTHLPNGTHAFSVRARDADGNIDPTPAEWTFSIDIGMPNAVIIDPQRDASVVGVVNVVGTAFDTDFEEYTVEYGKGKTPVEWLKVGRSSSPLRNNVLAFWDTRGLRGLYWIRLTAVDAFGHSVIDEITVNIVAAKETLNQQQGGSIADPTGNVSLYIPPNATTLDVEYTITTLLGEQIPESSGSNTGVILSAYDFQPEFVSLRKPATLTINVGESATHTFTGTRPQVFHWKGQWIAMGGSFDESAGLISTAIQELGTYALMEIPEADGEEDDLQITRLTCQPRILSPDGGGFSREATISFKLSASASVTVRIYNRAGGLKRTLITQELMLEGTNAVRWDGKDDDGDTMPSDLYIIAVEAGNDREFITAAVSNQ
jgi:ligand-binding sensor domain-containing protein